MSRLRPITANQKKVLSIISDYIEKYGYSPTLRDIAAELEISVKGAYDHCLSLRRKGYLNWERGMSRTMRVENRLSVEG